MESQQQTANPETCDVALDAAHEGLLDINLGLQVSMRWLRMGTCVAQIRSEGLESGWLLRSADRHFSELSILVP